MATGKDDSIFDSARFKLSFSGYIITSSAKIAVYKNHISLDNKLGEYNIDNFNFDSGSVSVGFIYNKIIETGTVKTYVVAIEGIVPDTASDSHDWKVSLENFVFQPSSKDFYVDSKDYFNLGTLPITEVN